jgi:hypothetical protein
MIAATPENLCVKLKISAQEISGQIRPWDLFDKTYGGASFG